MDEAPKYESQYDGAQFDLAIGTIVNGRIDEAVNSAHTSAQTAATQAEYATSAAQAVRKALDNIPPGAVPVIDDLTTGGRTAALSAEQGKVLSNEKADKQSVEAAMSNKAASSDTMMHRALTAAERNAPYSKSYISLAGPTEAFGPYPNFWSISYTFFDANNGVQEITGVTTRDKYYRTFSNGTISEWLLQATATPPQEYDLPLAAGYTAAFPCKYSKDQLSGVFVTFKMLNTSEISPGANTIATLPAGFRPSSVIHFVVFDARVSNHKIYPAWIGADGQIYVDVDLTISPNLGAGFCGSVFFRTD